MDDCDRLHGAKVMPKRGYADVCKGCTADRKVRGGGGGHHDPS